MLASIGAKSLSERLGDLDIWWHLKTGELIVRNHAIPATDPYSFTAAGKRWVVQEWGSEVVLHGINSAFGLRGIIVWRAIMLVMIYALVARLIIRRAGNRVGAWALIGLTAYAGSLSWTERPNLFSFFLFVVTLTLASRRDTRMWWFVPIAGLWANLHGMVILGLGLVALLAVIEWLKVWLRWDGADRIWARRLGLVTGVAFLASLVNPYGLGLHVHAFQLVRITSGIISEWQSPSFHEFVPLLFLALSAITIAGLALTPTRPDASLVGLTVAFLALGLVAIRNLPVSAIVLGYVACQCVPAVVDNALSGFRLRSRSEVGLRSGVILNVFSVLAVVLALALLVAARFPSSGSLLATTNRSFPITTIQRIAGHDIRLFTSDVWAGLALYARWPELRVAFDTRSDFYGPSIIRRYDETISGGAGWEMLLDRWCVTDILVNNRRPLATLLRASPEWSLVADQRVRGGHALLFTRAFRAAECRS